MTLKHWNCYLIIGFGSFFMHYSQKKETLSKLFLSILQYKKYRICLLGWLYPYTFKNSLKLSTLDVHSAYLSL